MSNQVTSTNTATDSIRKDLLKFRKHMGHKDSASELNQLIAVVDTVANLFNNASCTFHDQDDENCKIFAKNYPGAKIATLVIDQRECSDDLLPYDEHAHYVIEGPTFFFIPEEDRFEDLWEGSFEDVQMEAECFEYMFQDDPELAKLKLEDPDYWHTQDWYFADEG